MNSSHYLVFGAIVVVFVLAYFGNQITVQSGQEGFTFIWQAKG